MTDLLPPMIDLTDDDDLALPVDLSSMTTFNLPSTPPSPLSTPSRLPSKRKPSTDLTVASSRPRYTLRSHYFASPPSSDLSTPPPSSTIPPSLPPPVDIQQLNPSDLFLYPSTSSITSTLSTPSTCRILFISHFLSPLCIRLLHSTLSSITSWQTGKLHGHPIPRVSCWFASSHYLYAAKNWPHFPHPPFLLHLESHLTTHIRTHIDPSCRPFAGTLVNQYRSGHDSMGKHADDEGPLGPQPTIASLSVGCTRTFMMSRRERPEDGGKRKAVKFELNEGSLLLMAGDTQQHWLHWIPKQPEREGVRYNLTLRPWKSS